MVIDDDPRIACGLMRCRYFAGPAAIKLMFSKFSTRANCFATSDVCVTNTKATFSSRHVSRIKSTTCC